MIGTTRDQHEFVQAMKAAGYDYGEDALESAYTGWCLARETPVKPLQGEDAFHLKPLIQRCCLANGYSIKDGQTDLKDYVYKAAYALLWAVGAVRTHTGPVTPVPRADARIIQAVLAHHDRRWPPELTSGIMFYRGLRITLSQFLAAGGKV
jgi:hypothetical protein